MQEEIRTYMSLWFHIADWHGYKPRALNCLYQEVPHMYQLKGESA